MKDESPTAAYHLAMSAIRKFQLQVPQDIRGKIMETLGWFLTYTSPSTNSRSIIV